MMQHTKNLPAYFVESDPLYGMTIGNAVKTIAVTAAGPLEGTSTIAYSLALRSASAEHNTLLIDCNLHSPSVGNRLGVARTEWDFTNDSFLEAITHFPEMNLSILSAPNIAFASASFLEKALIKEKWQILREHYEVIIADCAPVNTTHFRHIPAELIGSVSDATIMVVLGGATREEDIQHAMQTLAQHDVHVLGTVMNNYQNPAFSDECAEILERLSRKHPSIGKLCQNLTHALKRMHACI